MNVIIQQDIEKVIFNNIIPWSVLKEKTFVVTGVTGLIGAQIVYVLLEANRKYDLNIRIIGIARNKQRAKKLFGDYIDGEKLICIFQDIRDELNIISPVHYIIHAASETSSVNFVQYPAETIDIAIQGLRNIMQLAKEKKILAGIFLSTMEVYGISNKETIKEQDYGYLNPLDVRSCYPESKRMCECMISSYAKEYKIPFNIARLTQTFGAGVELEDRRVFAQFAKSVVERKDIVLHSEGKTIRNYLYTSDAITAILIILLKGKIGEAYNVANKTTSISIYDMAILLTKKYSDRKIKIKFEIDKDEKYGYCQQHRTCINTEKIEDLGWRPIINLETAFERMIKVMEDEKNGTSTYI